jgi:hypothetical protein
LFAAETNLRLHRRDAECAEKKPGKTIEQSNVLIPPLQCPLGLKIFDFPLERVSKMPFRSDGASLRG